MESKVGLVKAEPDGTRIKEHLASALDLIGFKPKNSVNSVVIKPNLCYYWDAATGYTTDPKVVGGLIDLLREQYGADIDIKIVEADASAMQTRYAFPVLGYTKLAAEKDVALLNLSEDAVEEREIVVNRRKLSFKVPQTLLESDLFVNVPKLKVMRVTHITCGLKNIFGAIALPKKFTYHPFLEEAIVGMNKLVHPHLTLVDGLVALGRFPVRLGLVLASEDTFSVDWVAAQIMGYKPLSIKFLKLAVREGLGDPKNVAVVGEKIETFREDFPRENNLSFRLKWRLQFALLRAYRKVSGDVVPPVLEDI